MKVPGISAKLIYGIFDGHIDKSEPVRGGKITNRYVQLIKSYQINQILSSKRAGL